MSLISLLKRKNRKLLFTTPSHGGNFFILHKFYQWYKSDISEVDAFNPEQALSDAEKKASQIYGTVSTHFLANGSTAGIIASVLACCKQRDKILVWNNSHPCHKNAAKLAGAEIIEYELQYNKDWGIYEALKPEDAENFIKQCCPKAIIVTSPTYEGMVSDVRKLSEICKKYGVRLIVDEAHGALYPFSDRLPESAIKYADFTVQSLHKTAGGINPTALLHCNCELDIKSALRMISTTSPSYPMLSTIEANIKFLNSKRGRKKIENLIDNIVNIRSAISSLEFYGDDITKILIKKSGMTGDELSSTLFNRFNIEDEKTNEISTMLLTGIGTTKEKLTRLKYALLKLGKY